MGPKWRLGVVAQRGSPDIPVKASGRNVVLVVFVAIAGIVLGAPSDVVCISLPAIIAVLVIAEIQAGHRRAGNSVSVSLRKASLAGLFVGVAFIPFAIGIFVASRLIGGL